MPVDEIDFWLGVFQSVLAGISCLALFALLVGFGLRRWLNPDMEK